MRFCTTHRACESARSLDGLADPYCEVGLHLVMGHDFDSYCTLVDALIVTKEDGEYPTRVLVDAMRDNGPFTIACQLCMVAWPHSEHSRDVWIYSGYTEAEWDGLDALERAEP